jgi:hypothetical protein
MRINFFASIKRLIASLLYIFYHNYCFITSSLPELPQLPEGFNKKILMQRSNDLRWQFQQNSYVSKNFITKPKNFIIFSFTYVSESHALFYGDFCMNI